MKKLLLFAIFLLPLSLSAQEMTVAKMGKLLKEVASDIEGKNGAWSMTYQERTVLVITDHVANRMRIFTPVIAQKDMHRGEMHAMLEANFHSALDAKYGLYEGYVVSVFTHPLQELTEAQFYDALQQVATLADTFGTTFSSTPLIFGEPQEIPQEEKKKEKKS